MRMNAKQRIRCVLFDLGSTLWMRQEEATAQAKEHAYIKASTILRDERSHSIFPTLDMFVLGALLQNLVYRQVRQKKCARPEYEPDFVQATLEALHLAGVAQADRALAAIIFEALRIRIPASRVLYADTLSTLATLKQRGYLLGVVTNRSYGGPLFREDVETMGLLNYIEYGHMAISADLGVCKPHPAIFQHALKSLNVSPEETAMVGDNLEADIAGARRLNIFSIWKPKDMPLKKRDIPKEIEPDLEIGQLSELLEIFEKPSRE